MKHIQQLVKNCNVNNVQEVILDIQDYFYDFWIDPISNEVHIFCQYIVMEIIKKHRLSPKVLSDYWYEDNTRCVQKMGEDFFNKFGKNRDNRIKEYEFIYSEFKEFSISLLSDEYSLSDSYKAFIYFGNCILKNVEQNYVDNKVNINRGIKLTEKCICIINYM